MFEFILSLALLDQLESSIYELDKLKIVSEVNLRFQGVKLAMVARTRPSHIGFKERKYITAWFYEEQNGNVRLWLVDITIAGNISPDTILITGWRICPDRDVECQPNLMPPPN